MSERPPLDKETLEHLVIIEKLSNVKIAKMYGVPRKYVSELLKKNNIVKKIIKNTKCSICDKYSVREYDGFGYCDKHFYQMSTHGKILDRTRFDKNEIIVSKEYAEIVIYSRSGQEKCRAKIDIEDIDLVKNYKWSYSDYVCSDKTLRLHRLVAGVLDSPEKIIDHINRDVLDNRKNNLRLVTNQENVINRGTQSNNSSGYTGVSWHKRSNLWRAFIQFNRKFIHLGMFSNKEDAIKARKRAEETYFGEFAPIKS